MGRDRSWVVRITTAECAVELRCSAGGFCSVALLWDVRIVRIQRNFARILKDFGKKLEWQNIL